MNVDEIIARLDAEGPECRRDRVRMALDMLRRANERAENGDMRDSHYRFGVLHTLDVLGIIQISETPA